MDDDAVKQGLRREAVDWVHRLDSGRATEADADEFRRWRAASPAHAAAFAEANSMWKAFEPAARNLRWRREIPAALAVRQLTSDPSVNRRVVLAGGMAGASIAAGYAVVHPPLDLWPSISELRADYRTATGEQHEFTLERDFSVRLNTQTSITLGPADAGQVELIAGEAFFVSKPRPQRPLVVLAAQGRITATRADFDVRHIGTQVCVTCVEGDVAIEVAAEGKKISAGQQLRYDPQGLGDVVTADVELATAWRQGALIFRSTPLSQVVEEINRYRRGRVLLFDTELAQKPISGRFRIEHMDDILVRLDQAFGIKSRALPGGIVLLT